MWGNAMGWAISAVLVLVMGRMVWVVHQAGALSEPTSLGREAWVYERIALPVRPGVVVAMEQECDAGPLYREAIAEYRSNPAVYETLAAGRGAQSAPLRGIELLVEASACRRVRLFSDSPEEVAHYQSHVGPIEALHVLGRAAVRLGLAERDTSPGDAERYARAGFALGAKMYEERVVYEQLRVGLALMGEAAVVLERLAEARGDAERAESLRRFNTARVEYYEQHITPIWRVISSIDPGVIARHSGDILLFTSDFMEEPMWRVEATLTLGRQRYHAGRPGDSRAAERMLAELRGDRDTAVAAAARAAEELSVEQYRMMGR